MTEFMWPEERQGLERASSRWWLFLLLGAVSVVLGVLLVFDLFAAVRTVALLVAISLIAEGIGELVSVGRYRSVLGVVAGLVLLAAGVMAAIWPGITLWVLAVVVGIGLMVSGGARIMGALALRVEGWGWLFVAGVLSVVAGLLALVWPGATILVLGLLLGLRILFFGISELAFGLALHDVRGSLR
ncbi:MAG: HdeD family acid-resistance protein [Acidimicrobiales bacterium]